MSNRVPTLSLCVALALPLSACFVDGAPFDPEVCPQEIVVEVDRLQNTLTIQMDTIDILSCPAEFAWTVRHAPRTSARAR